MVLSTTASRNGENTQHWSSSGGDSKLEEWAQSSCGLWSSGGVQTFMICGYFQSMSRVAVCLPQLTPSVKQLCLLLLCPLLVFKAADWSWSRELRADTSVQSPDRPEMFGWDLRGLESIIIIPWLLNHCWRERSNKNSPQSAAIAPCSPSDGWACDLTCGSFLQRSSLEPCQCT